MTVFNGFFYLSLGPRNNVAFIMKVNWSEDFAVPEVADATTSSDSRDTSEVSSSRETEDRS